MKITGTSNDCSSSLTASRPELPSASWMSARIRPGCFVLGQRERLRVGARDAEHAMAEALDQAFQLHRDEGFVLDDQDVGRDLGGELAAGFLDQRAQRHHVDVEDARRVRLGEAFERDQQECLPRQRRDAGELALAGQRRPPGVGRAVERDRIPDLGEQPVERDAGPAFEPDASPDRRSRPPRSRPHRRRRRPGPRSGRAHSAATRANTERRSSNPTRCLPPVQGVQATPSQRPPAKKVPSTRNDRSAVALCSDEHREGPHGRAVGKEIMKEQKPLTTGPGEGQGSAGSTEDNGAHREMGQRPQVSGSAEQVPLRPKPMMQTRSTDPQAPRTTWAGRPDQARQDPAGLF